MTANDQESRFGGAWLHQIPTAKCDSRSPRGNHRRKMTVRLFAGIVTTSSNANPESRASGRTSVSRQRTPHLGSRVRKLSSKDWFDGAVWAPWRLKGP